MKRIIGIIAAGGMMGLVMPTMVHAQGRGTPLGGGPNPLTATFAITATIQGPDTVADNGKSASMTSKSIVGKLTQKDIIDRVEFAHGATPSKDAILVISSGFIHVNDGGNFYETTPFLTMTFDAENNAVWTGVTSTNDVTGDVTRTYTGHYVVQFEYQPVGGSFVKLNGLATEVYSIGPVNKKGTKATTDSLSVTLSGIVDTGDGKGVASGTLKASVKGTELP